MNMKKEIIKFLNRIRCTAKYSGKTKTIYITDPYKKEDQQSAESAVYYEFGFDLGFKLVTN